MTRTKYTVLAAAVTAALALGSCGSSGGGESAEAEDVPGITDTTVKVGTHQPLTGPAAAGYASISPATKAYFDYVNANGGVHGRTIEYSVKDDGYNPANTQSVVRELVLQDEVFALVGGLGTPPHSSVLDFLNDNEVPDLFVASGSPTWNQPEEYPYTYGFMQDYDTEAKVLATYVQEEFPDGTYCLFGQDDDFGADFKTGLESALGSDGLASSQVYSTANTDVAAQISALQAAGCDVNFLASINGFSAQAIGTAAKLGYFPKWAASSAGGDYNTLASYLGENTDKLLEGFISANYLPAYSDETDEWTAKFSEINEEYNPGAEFDGNTIFGMSVGYLFVEALKEAGENPTRESLLEALESGNVKGNGHVPLGFSADSHAGYTGGMITLVSGGVQSYTGTPYAVDGDSVSPYTEERPAMPANGIPQ
ncbi:ABC transporter substrate-binding protein [Arthrobacter sp. zg-Y820]|uniref:ABC transporter substrate-binding protein n=1 Tax=unclassified Arthrobacter TaxID=235627 RepID=UPI001E40840D|nr:MULTISPECIES: ABC transporter substrate-binding protein [unclassified Arthrobacter]MCC9196066.1 ABC transporter substrate-binding protein [Arthrobacter sp. zg-Y820]MDK1278925.1 ABC transporter substrate-binding protein [Arthrobacter sp. zg.Y820]WIB08661.1 ABC transporter substrate-binding protein [Arthrobacter sp. zg-Y820]